MSLTFAELDVEVAKLSRMLATLGVRRGDRVCTRLSNGLTAALMPHALLRLGATLVPLNIRLTPAESDSQVGEIAPRVVIDDSTDFTSIEESDTPLTTVHSGDHVLAIIYTSGTTGRPKGAMLTVQNFWWSAIGSALNLGTQPDDRWLATMPLFHVGGLSILMRSAIYGITAVIHEGFDAVAVNEAIDHGDSTIVSVVAVMLERLLDVRNDAPFPPTLRCLLLGGGPASTSLLERCAAIKAPVVQTYGLTETCSQVATLGIEDAGKRIGASGKVLYPNELRISDENEILVRGPVVMAGYFKKPAETSEAIVDGWLKTGDAGRLDDEGYLYVLDRRNDLIITGGENVYPAEVEAALASHSSVAEAGVIGIPDATWGQRVVAIVRSRTESGDPEMLKAHCATRLASYKRPSEFRFVNEPLPRTASGKLRRSALRDLISRK